VAAGNLDDERLDSGSAAGRRCLPVNAQVTATDVATDQRAAVPLLFPFCSWRHDALWQQPPTRRRARTELRL